MAWIGCLNKGRRGAAILTHNTLKLLQADRKMQTCLMNCVMIKTASINDSIKKKHQITSNCIFK